MSGYLPRTERDGPALLSWRARAVCLLAGLAFATAVSGGIARASARESHPHVGFPNQSHLLARTAGPCDPGANTGALHVFTVTLKCIVSLRVFYDPTLKAKSRCILSMGGDVLTTLMPAGKVSLIKHAARPIGRSAELVAGELERLHRFDGALIDGFDRLGKAMTLVSHNPKDVVELFLTSDRAMTALAKKLSGHPVLLKHLAELQTQLKSLFTTLTGIDDYRKCREAFSSPTPKPGGSGAGPSPAQVPVLGSATEYPNGEGYGHVAPSQLFFGGDPTSLVTGISWTSWGNAQATGQGTGDYVWPGESVAAGSIQTPAQIVAWDLGDCAGHTAYLRVEWFFPQYGESFSPDRGIPLCNTGSMTPPASQDCGATDIQSPAGYATDVQATGLDCATALQIVAESPAIEYLYSGPSRFQTAGMNCGTEGYDPNLAPPPTIYGCAWGSESIFFELEDTSIL